MARKIDLAGLDRAVLSKHEIGEAASKIAVMPAVRRALVEAQRAFARRSRAPFWTDAISAPSSARMHR